MNKKGWKMTKIIAGYNPTGDTLWRALFEHVQWGIIGYGSTRQQAINDLIEKSDPHNIPSDISSAFQLNMAEKGIQYYDWMDQFSEWLTEHVEVA